MHDVAPRCSPNRRHGVRHGAGEQDAIVPHRARRRHRHHLDRRHDGDHPRLRPVAARSHRADRPEHDLSCRSSASPASPAAPRSPKLLKAAEPDARATRARIEAADHDAAVRRHRLGAGPGRTQQRVFYRDRRRRPLVVLGTSENFVDGTCLPILQGGSSPAPTSSTAATCACWATPPTRRSSRRAASIRSASSCASARALRR